MSEREALEKLYEAMMRYLAEHDGFEKYGYMLPAIEQAELVLFSGTPGGSDGQWNVLRALKAIAGWKLPPPLE